MKSKPILIIPLTLIILGMGIFTFSYASVESEAEEDIQSGCRNGQTLVHRFTYNDYVCVNPSTADRWVELKIAEIQQKFTSEDDSDDEENTDLKYESKYPGAPPAPPKKSSTDFSLSECREGQVSVYRFAHGDTFCVNSSTAVFWEGLGLAQIVNDDSDDVNDDSDDVNDDSDDVNDDSDDVNDNDHVTSIDDDMMEETPIEDMLLNNESNSLDYQDFPKIYQIQNGIWAVLDFDKATSVFVEGDSGIVVIDSLNSYESNKKALSEFKTISDKKIKVIVLTSFNTNILSSYDAFTDDDAKIVLSDALLQIYQNNNLNITNAITYDNDFSIHVSGVEMELSYVEGFNSIQTYVLFPSNGEMLIGDEKSGIFPVVLDSRFFRSTGERS